ncbi:unnamed protein product [Dibothriocephalus latus]|uniref:DUSP domain-containing protein n=1 Tax=Dibothriocephalus latus TaxID=60516 RepID=A0A3P7NKI7_DIBLA|nr:unnamed protein product [Dibothriocephalus latus]
MNIAWFDKWKKFTGYADSNDAAPEPDECDSPPGEIDNTSLMEGKQLRPNLLVNADVVFIPESLWDLFSCTYGCCHKDTEIFKRKYLKASTGKLSLDLYPSNICLVEKNNKDHKLEETFCNAETIGHLKSVIRKARHYEHCDIRLFDPKVGEEVKAGDDFTLQEACLDGTRVSFEFCDLKFYGKILSLCLNRKNSVGDICQR